jgi:hypothetical protein
MTRPQAQGAYALWNTPTQRVYRQAAPSPILPKERRPFSKPKTDQLTGTSSALKTAQIYQFPTSLKAEAADKFPPLEAHQYISRPEPRMSDAAAHFHMLRFRLALCLADRQYDEEAYLTECRLREQAAYIIGCSL